MNEGNAMAKETEDEYNARVIRELLRHFEDRTIEAYMEVFDNRDAESEVLAWTVKAPGTKIEVLIRKSVDAFEAGKS